MSESRFRAEKLIPAPNRIIDRLALEVEDREAVRDAERGCSSRCDVCRRASESDVVDCRSACAAEDCRCDGAVDSRDACAADCHRRSGDVALDYHRDVERGCRLDDAAGSSHGDEVACCLGDDGVAACYLGDHAELVAG